MAAGTLALALLCLLLVVDSGRLYLEKRKLQRVVDNAALEAVVRKGNCVKPALTADGYAKQSATRNGFTVNANRTLRTDCGTLTTDANNLRKFNTDLSKSDAIKVTATSVVTSSMIAGIRTLVSSAPVSLTTQLTATAVAAAPRPTLAQLTLMSTMATVDTAKSILLNNLFKGLLGGNVSIDALGWQGLVNANINLLTYLDQLAIRTNVSAGNYTELLSTKTTVGTLIQATIDAATINGATADVITNLGRLQVAAISTVPVTVGDFLKLQTGTGSAGLDANIQLFQLVEAVAQLSNKNNAVYVSTPVNIPGLATVTARVQVIEPPQFSFIGDPGFLKQPNANPLGPNAIFVRTAQVRTLLSINMQNLTLLTAVNNAISGLVSPITNVLNSVLSLNLLDILQAAGCLLGTPCKQVSIVALPAAQIDISLQLGSAQSYVTDYTCISDTNKSLTVTTQTSAVDLQIGKIDPDIAFSSTKSLVVNPIPLIDLGTMVCSGLLSLNCGPRTPFDGGGIGFKLDTTATNKKTMPTNQTVTLFPNPKNIKVPLVTADYQSVDDRNVLTNLLDKLNGITINAYVPVTQNLLGSIMTAAAGLLTDVTKVLLPLVTTLLSNVLNQAVQTVLDLLGISLGNAQIGANLSCGQTGTAYLVI